jgi:predicted  nucleic acid-binding Zn-ribbon protein
MAHSDQVKGELDALHSRKDSIAAELDEARHALREGREAVVTGKGDTESLTTLQARVTALEGAAEAVAERITQKQGELAEAAESERVAGVRKEMASVRAKASGLTKEIAEARNGLMATYDEAVSTFRRKGVELDTCIRGFRELAASTGEGENITIPTDPAWHAHPVAAAVIQQMNAEQYRERSSRGFERMLAAER